MNSTVRLAPSTEAMLIARSPRPPAGAGAAVGAGGSGAGGSSVNGESVSPERMRVGLESGRDGVARVGVRPLRGLPEVGICSSERIRSTAGCWRMSCSWMGGMRSRATARSALPLTWRDSASARAANSADEGRSSGL